MTLWRTAKRLSKSISALSSKLSGRTKALKRSRLDQTSSIRSWFAKSQLKMELLTIYKRESHLDWVSPLPRRATESIRSSSRDKELRNCQNTFWYTKCVSNGFRENDKALQGKQKYSKAFPFLFNWMFLVCVLKSCKVSWILLGNLSRKKRKEELRHKSENMMSI